MALRDVTHVVFDRGTGPFNEAAALEAYHLVAKMDDADACEFVFHVVNEVLENTIIENREPIQKHLDRTIAKALVYSDLDALAEGLSAEERAEVKKQLLSAVSKAEWDPNEHPRGEHGLFRIDPHKRISKPEADAMRAAGKGDIPPHPEFNDFETKEHREMYRGQYAQIAAKLGRLTGEQNARLHYADGSTKDITAVNGPALAREIRPHEAKNVVAVEVTPYKPMIGGRIADLTGSLGDGTLAGAKFITSGQPHKPGEGKTPFTEQWYSAHPVNGTQQMYNRIGAGSELLGQVAGGSPKLQAAAKFGSLVGQHGPAAEQVFGPPARRLAYRYRGTERRPDPGLAQAYGNAIHSQKSQSGKFTAEENAHRAPTWSEREAGREQIIGWLQQPGRAPSRQLSALQLAAGHTPPSEGVLLNADGQIVTTAVGAADDWYLPFNLRHLASLKGGEYIRSRSTGGLTTEDIYTGLMTGARRVTVVSRSGIFSIEFDPELRGGRRNNDKALRMTQRYGELLDAVQSGKVERQNLPPEVLRSIRREVDETYGTGISAEERSAAINALTKERKENPASIQGEIDALDERIEGIRADRELTPDERDDFTRQRIGLASQKEFFYRLNGLGYKAAQDALKEQFPYYIASTQTTHHLGHQILGPNDPGYVEPGALRPTAARANLFGGAVGPNGEKHSEQTAISARTADRARPMVDRYGGHKVTAAEEEGVSAGAPSSSGGAMPKPRESQADLVARLARQTQQREAAVKVHAGLNNWVVNLKQDGKPAPGTEEAHRYEKMDPITFALAIDRPGELEKFRDAVEAAHARTDPPDYDYPGRREFEKAMGPKGGGKYDFARAAVAPLAIFDFEDLSVPRVADAGKQRLALNPGKTVGEASEEELAREATLRAKLDQAVRQVGDVPEKRAVVNAILEQAGLLPLDEGGRALVNGYVTKPEMLHKSMESIQVQRAANAKKLGLAPAGAIHDAKGDVLAQLMPAGERRHPSGREFTADEKARGEYYGDDGNWHEI